MTVNILTAKVGTLLADGRTVVATNSNGKGDIFLRLDDDSRIVGTPYTTVDVAPTLF